MSNAPRRTTLDALVRRLRAEDAMNVDARCVHMIWIKRAHFDDFFHFCDRDLAGRGHHRIEVHRRVPVDEVAKAVALPSLDERIVADDAFLEDVAAAAKRAGLLLRRKLSNGTVRCVAYGQASVGDGRTGS